jgi:thiamine-phosphate pyrophosphorylase
LKRQLSFARRGLYAITPDTADSEKLLAQVAAVIRGGAAMLQYRNKSSDSVLRRTQAGALAKLCRAHGVPLIINDDTDLALEIGADGVHLGSEDGDLAVARRKLGSAYLLGVSCYNRIELAAGAQAAGVDYLAFGSFFASSTKPLAVRANPAMITEAKAGFDLPVAAIGGITADNAAPLVEAGADWLCVISALFQAPEIEAEARKFATLFDQKREY